MTIEISKSATESALYNAICANPHEVQRRLVFADWLDEQPTAKECPSCNGSGEESEKNFHGAWDTWKCWKCEGSGSVPDTSDADRAEFIRVQCEWSSWERPGGMFEVPPTESGKKRLKWCLDRESELLTAHPEWSQLKCPACRGIPQFRMTRLGPNPTCGTCRGTLDLFSQYSSEDPSGMPLEPRNVTFRYGFPWRVSCTLDELGREEPCETCGGDLFVCLKCNGTDCLLVPSPWAAAVVRQSPVVEFVVTDRRPEQDRGDQRPVWFNRGQVSNQTVMESTIPEFLYEEMRGYDNVPCPPHIGKWYPTAESAVTALAIAAGRVVRQVIYGGKP